MGFLIDRGAYHMKMKQMVDTALRAFIHPTILCLSSAAFALNPYSNSELDGLEKEFIEQINQSNQVFRIPLAVDYINHLLYNTGIN